MIALLATLLATAPAPRKSTLQLLEFDTERGAEILIRLGLTIVAAWIAQRALFFLVWRIETWLARASHGTEHGIQRAKTIRQILRNGITTVVFAWAVIHSLEIFGWDVKPLLVGASILGA